MNDFRVRILKAFNGDSLRAAGYLGEITQISILLNAPDEALVRARLAATLANEALRRQSRALRANKFSRG